MKWTVAGAGALLCVAGVYALISGGSIIQVERGWATFIAGAVLLGAGVVVMGIAALMGRIDRLTDLLRSAMTPNAAPASSESETADQQQAEFHDVAPPPREVAVDPVPTPESWRPQQTAVREERPAALRDFQFVFPPAEVTPQAPAPYAYAAPAAYEAPLAYEPPAPVEPPAEEALAPVQPLEKPAYGRPSRMEWLRRGKKEAAPEPEPAAEIAAFTVESREEHEAPADPIAEIEEPFGETNAEPEAEVEPVAQAQPEPDADEEPVSQPEVLQTSIPQASVASLDPFGSDWLERALAGADEEDEPTSRLRRRATIVQSETIEAEEPAPEPVQHVDEPEAAAQEPSDAPAPVEIGRYRANDVAYVMFSDGSITAETPTGGSYRFDSLPELRAFIERGSV